MPFPTLSELAAKSVALGIHAETISLDFPLDTKSSNAVARELVKFKKEKDFKNLETFKNQLSITEINLRNCRFDAEAVQRLSNFNLVSLKFGRLLQGYSGDTLDIVNLLIRATNNYSRRSMIHLGLPEERRTLIAGWENEVSKILPNLQSIDISYKTFGERFQFSNFCTCFPNILVLDISEAIDLSSLQGIKNLKKLQKLIMHNVKFADFNGYEELSELKNLKYLDVSIYDKEKKTNPIKEMLAAGVRMGALEFLDCSLASVTEHELKTFAENHPSLKTVVAICTPCDQSRISGVKMLNMSSPSSFSECFEYALLIDRQWLAVHFIADVIEKLQTSRGNLGNIEPRHLTKAVQFVLREPFDQAVKLLTWSYYVDSGFLNISEYRKTFL
ncbi:hypothetical protein B9Z55_004770 [Caenorhabditis nigoni]|uniref:Zer-1-like leucine-rich repeats region domain-containing protein n=1 Tax=Caenorhabditis nigoni TaxID=1611254 RepID=A0A2G5UXZ5_9PELO|nr:hypothetical protein B9Z55_004770 [Caenorhabditis nigoni]